MQARLRFILDRLNADLSTVGLGSVSVVDNPDPGWGEGLTVFNFRGHQTSANPEHPEDAAALLASTFQDDVVDEQSAPWPEVNGKPLWASAESGVACWHLDGTPWCAIGQLTGALAAHAEQSAE